MNLFARKKIFGLTLLCFLTNVAFSQKGVDDGSKYGQGEDSIRCIKNFSLYREYSKHRDYAQALPFWKVVFDECPKASKNVYLDGVKIYRSFLKTEKEVNRQTELVDTLMLVYNRRIEYFGETGKVRGRQGVDLLKYKRSEDSKYIEQAYGYLTEAMKLQGKKVTNPVIATYMSSSISLLKLGIFDENKIIEDYLKVTEILNTKLEKKPNNKNLIALKQSVDQNFVKDGPGECNTLVDYFSKEYDSKKEDIAFLQMITTLLKNRECTDSDLFFKSAKSLHAKEPSAESAVNIALLAFNKEIYPEAISYYQQAVELETEEIKKADYYLNLALCFQKTNNKIKARESALKAAKAKPGFGDPYIIIGQLYAGSKGDCQSISLPNSIYWAAIDKFNKAKSIDPVLQEKANKLILTYSKYFPNKEKAFFLDIHEGSPFKVECWINENTTARFK